MRLFVAMPYGTDTGRLKPDDPASETTIPFDKVWTGMIKPAIPTDWEDKRADELHQPGLIDQLYTEWLLEADVVLADLTFSNPNVFYELGIRQALSAKSTVLIAQRGTELPFDVRNQSVVHYDAFDGTSVEDFKKALRKTLTAAAAKPSGSPVHTFLPGLYIDRYESGKTPDLEIEALQAEIKRLHASATTEVGTAEQFERRLAIRSELTDLLSRIMRAQLDNTKLLKEHATDPVYMQAVSSTLSQENAFLLSEARLLIDQIPELVGTVEYNTVAVALHNAFEPVSAEEYFRRSIEVARTPFERTSSQRSYAYFLFAQQRFDEGRALYEDAVGQAARGTSLAHQTDGYTLQSWAYNELTFAGDGARADELFARARAEYEAIGNPALRDQLLTGLAAMLNSDPSSGGHDARGLMGWLRDATS